jgi:hypothetical protein
VITETLDFTPRRVDIKCKAGDSVVFEIILDDIANIPTPVWTAQVADERREHVDDFVMTPTATGTMVELQPAQTRALGELGGTTQRVVGAVGSETPLWAGRFDVQLGYDAGLVRTLVRGVISILEDVTR